MKLIENWKQAWRYYTVRIAGRLILLDFGYEYLPVMQTYLPESWVRWVGLVLIAARIIRQQLPAEQPKVEAKP